MNYPNSNASYHIKQNSYQARKKGKLPTELSPQQGAWEAGTSLLLGLVAKTEINTYQECSEIWRKKKKKELTATLQKEL